MKKYDKNSKFYKYITNKYNFLFYYIIKKIKNFI